MSAEEQVNCGLTVTERDALKNKLNALPETMPPRAVWQRIERQAQAEGLFRRRWFADSSRWLAGTGIAAAVVLAVLGLPQKVPEAPRAASSVPNSAAATGVVPGAGLELQTIDALMTRSRGLERDLRRLPASPQLMRASTAVTIDELERRIAAIDYHLNDPRRRMTRREQELFWRERVRLMDSLVQLRYAQLQRGAF